MSLSRLSFSDVCGYSIIGLILMVMIFSLSSETAEAKWPPSTVTGTALTSPTAVVKKVETFVDEGADSSRKIVYGLGGLGAVALGSMAMFGRFNWNWLFSMFGGLSFVALYNIGINSITGESI